LEPNVLDDVAVEIDAIGRPAWTGLDFGIEVRQVLHAIAPGTNPQMMGFQENRPAVCVSGFMSDFKKHGCVSACSGCLVVLPIIG
jgi:hypothetical protein